MVRVGEDLGLARIAFSPLPILLEFFIEAVAVLEALNVASGTRIPVPIPSTPHVCTRFEDLH